MTLSGEGEAVKGQRIRRGPGQQIVDGAKFHLVDEIRYVQKRAAKKDSRVITLPHLLLFSTETGDAWLLDPADHLAVPVARDGEPLPVHIEETDKTFTIEWMGTYRIDGPAFIYTEKDSGRIRTILGYPTEQILKQQLPLKISSILG
jgi:hypothetical protein